jgi:glycosyltransferase involved in cell wall biosynthesis
MLCIIIPTYNESQNILNLLNKICHNLKPESNMEDVILDVDNSQDITRSIISDYLKDARILYRYGCMSRQALLLRDIQKSISFFSRAARFCAAGTSGLLVNYSISSSLAYSLLANISCINAKFVSIICSISSNLLLNEKWTFEEDIGGEHALPSKSLF